MKENENRLVSDVTETEGAYTAAASAPYGYNTTNTNQTIIPSTTEWTNDDNDNSGEHNTETGAGGYYDSTTVPTPTPTPPTTTETPDDDTPEGGYDVPSGGENGSSTTTTTDPVDGEATTPTPPSESSSTTTTTEPEEGEAVTPTPPGDSSSTTTTTEPEEGEAVTPTPPDDSSSTTTTTEPEEGEAVTPTPPGDSSSTTTTTEPSESENTEEDVAPIIYTKYETTVNNIDFHILRTKVKYIRPEIINSPINETEYVGINGSFFGVRNDNYHISPDGPDAQYPFKCNGSSISWRADSSKIYVYNGDADHHYKRGTLVICTNDEGEIVPFVGSFSTTMEVADECRSKNYSPLAMIGGGDLAPELTDEAWRDIFDAESWGFRLSVSANWEGTFADLALYFKNMGEDSPSSLHRSALGVKYEKNENNEDEWHAYLVVSQDDASLKTVRTLFNQLGCTEAIFLDGSYSSQMRWEDTTGWHFITHEFPPRHIWNMIRILKENEC